MCVCPWREFLRRSTSAICSGKPSDRSETGICGWPEDGERGGRVEGKKIREVGDPMGSSKRLTWPVLTDLDRMSSSYNGNL